MWYEYSIINQLIDSLEIALSKYTGEVEFIFCLNYQTYIEKPIDSNLWKHFEKTFIEREFFQNQNVKIIKILEDQPFYNIGDFRREMYSPEQNGYNIWGESDCLVPHNFFHILDIMWNQMKDRRHTLSFSSRKMWDNTWNIVEHSEIEKFNSVVTGDGDPEALGLRRWDSTLTPEDLKQLNASVGRLNIERLPVQKIDGALFCLGNNLPTFIPKDMHFAREDSCAGYALTKHKIPQYAIKNVYKGHNYVHPDKRKNTNASRTDTTYQQYEKASKKAYVNFMRTL